MKSNIRRFYTYSVMWSLVVLVTSGSVAQTFLLECGFPEKNVTSLISFMQIVQVLTIFFFSKWSDKVRSVVKSMAGAHFLDIPICVFLLALCFIPVENSQWIFILLLAVGALYSISVGINNVLVYKLPYHIMDMSYYARYIAVSGALIGIVSVVFSVLSHYAQNAFGFMTAMRGLYFLIVLLWIVMMISAYSMKEQKVSAPTKTAEKINLLKYGPFVKLILPNVLRGFALGIVGMGITIGYYAELIDGKSANYVIIITNALTIVGSFAFSKIAKYVKDKNIILLCSAVIAATLPFLTVGGTAAFLAVYSVMYFFLIILNNAVPVTVTKIIDYKVAGQYSAGRMLLNTLGTSAAGFLCVPLFDAVGVVPTMIITAILQILSGIGYYAVLITINRKNNIKENVS